MRKSQQPWEKFRSKTVFPQSKGQEKGQGKDKQSTDRQQALNNNRRKVRKKRRKRYRKKYRLRRFYSLSFSGKAVSVLVFSSSFPSFLFLAFFKKKTRTKQRETVLYGYGSLTGNTSRKIRISFWPHSWCEGFRELYGCRVRPGTPRSTSSRWGSRGSCAEAYWRPGRREPWRAGPSGR